MVERELNKPKLTQEHAISYTDFAIP